MSGRPFLFSAPMVRALLDGTKTQTRRMVKPQPGELDRPFLVDGSWHVTDSQGGHMSPLGNRNDGACPYGVPGDLLWARETWQLHERFTDVGRVVYAASVQRGWSEAHEDIPVARIGDCKAKPFQQGFRPSIHMPRWASRLTLEITEVRVERLQAISEADAKAEGIIEYEPTDEDPAEFAYEDGGDIWNNAVSAYAALWRKLNSPDSWDANPWVWAVSFAVHRANVDQVLAARAA